MNIEQCMYRYCAVCKIRNVHIVCEYTYKSNLKVRSCNDGIFTSFENVQN